LELLRVGAKLCIGYSQRQNHQKELLHSSEVK
jgi:hypothetical protein